MAKGLFGKMFGKKSDSGFGSSDADSVHRIEKREPIVEEKRVEDEPGQLWLKAKKWREDQAMNEPLVKRNQYKKKY